MVCMKKTKCSGEMICKQKASTQARSTKNRGLFSNSRFFRFHCLDSGEICLACWILELKALFGVDKFNKVHVEVP